MAVFLKSCRSGHGKYLAGRGSPLDPSTSCPEIEQKPTIGFRLPMGGKGAAQAGLFDPMGGTNLQLRLLNSPQEAAQLLSGILTMT
jgi:hypothetical protein